MFKLLVCFLFLATYSNAEEKKSYYYYDKVDSSIPRDSFRVYIRPQLRSIVNEYYHLIRKLEPLSQPIINLKKNVIRARSRWEEFQKKCKSFHQNDCLNSINSILDDLQKVENDIFKFRSSPLSTKSNKEKIFDQVLLLKNNLNTIFQLNSRIIHQVETLKITPSDAIWDKKMLLNIDQDFYRIKIKSEVNFTKLIPKEYATQFHFLWNEFISPIEQVVLKNQDDLFFMKGLERYNISWNSFHMKLAKSNKKIDKQYSKIIQIMHNRWNSILKVILKRW